MRIGRFAMVGATTVGALTAAGAILVSSVATASPQPSTSRVIVVFKNQEPGLPASSAFESQRASKIHGIQAPITAQMIASGGQIRHSYTVINAVAATVSHNEASQLASNPAVSEVIPDQVI